ncbi:MAG: SAM-dependent methyltransferase [Bacteroidota bacterium]
MINNNQETFFEKLKNCIDNNELIKMIVNNRRQKSIDLKSIIVTIVKLKAGNRLNFVYRHQTKDITKNYEFEEGINILKKAMEDDFYNADIYANTQNINLIISPNGKVQLKTHEPTLQALSTFNHDRIKERLISPIGNIYLRELKITNANWEVRREMSDKYKQINRYIELLEPELTEISLKDNYHIVDMGSGKGYLTFALYDYLTNTQKKNVAMTGVEFREELVDACNEIAKKAEYNKLTFVKGSIEKTELSHIDILIALHACDTATDDAIYRGISANAQLIVVAPCCHKQIRKEFNVSNELSNVVKYGILKERQAEIITDSLRAMLMEAFGYKTKVFEFVSTEHTPKNLLIVGRKTTVTKKDKEQILSNVQKIKDIYGIDKHYLETLLKL